ncbi:type II toxin-antitoxin system HicA family toxin [Nostoc sp. C110]|uniref:type II toxin-antitoxin system HicA family toxin n=1 Tax=Nostoc sp. C110 TaxID=3349876 RepID=UPI00370DB1E0
MRNIFVHLLTNAKTHDNMTDINYAQCRLLFFLKNALCNINFTHTVARTKGSHRQFKHPDKPSTVTVSGKPNVDVPIGTLKNI